MISRHLAIALLLISLAYTSGAQTRTITGTIRDADTREPLAFANLVVAGASRGTTSDANGAFTLVLDDNGTNQHIVASFVGYRPDTVRLVAGQQRYFISLRNQYQSLDEVVVVSGTLKEVSKLNSPIPVEIYTPALFYKNPSPNIFESLNMINGVQPQLNCNVCNTGDIHINGMEGPYTMVLIDGMPIVSSLSTVYGLAGIPNSLVKRIEIVKGPASTLYGSEAVGGLINIITKDPATAPRLKLNVSATTYAEYNVDVSARWKVKQTTAMLGINYFNFQNRVDRNSDNFTDITQQNRFSVFNKWNFHRPQQRVSSLAWRYVYEDRWGGQLQWNKQYRGSNQVYGESIYTQRAELIGTEQLPIPRQHITLDYSYNYHHQDSYYGIHPYQAQQQVGFTQLRWDKTWGKHDLLMGLPFRFIYYNDNTPGTTSADGKRDQPMKTYLPGLFIQDEWKISTATTLLTGVRYDHHNTHGSIFSPRVSVKYMPIPQHTFRLSAGNGFRVVNLFTEDHVALTGAREVKIAHHLRPEQSWNVNLNYTTQHQHRHGYVGIDASLFYTYFTNKIIGDFLSDPESIIFDNLKGHAVSRGITINTEAAFTNSLKIMAGVTMMDVYRVEQDVTSTQRIPQLFAPRVSGTYSISYTWTRPQITFDITARVNGPMHLPTVPNDFRPAVSPWYQLVNLQCSKSFSTGLECYAGVKNIFNFVPDNPLYNPQTPFDPSFDTAYNYAPLQGAKGFVGVRYTLP